MSRKNNIFGTGSLVAGLHIYDSEGESGIYVELISC